MTLFPDHEARELILEGAKTMRKMAIVYDQAIRNGQAIDEKIVELIEKISGTLVLADEKMSSLERRIAQLESKVN